MMDSLLKKHLEWTPRMAPQDAVKLAYQSAFGCGHLLSARDTCADFVLRERESTPEDAAAAPSVPLGGGLCRLSLAAPATRALSPERMADCMLLTDAWVRARSDNEARFEALLDTWETLAEAGETPFSAEELRAYLLDYRARGCPVVSHSEAYRAAYAPSYRVVLSDLAALVPVMIQADERLARDGSALIVLDGPCGGGKTTLAGLLGKVYGVSPIAMDDFFLPPAMRTPERLAQPGGNVHAERFLSEVLKPLLAGQNFVYGRFNCQTGLITPCVHMAAPVTIIEGSYSHHPAFEDAYDRLHALRVFVCVDEAEQLRRLGLRNSESIEAFRTRWIPLEKRYFEAYDREARADVRLPSRANP